MQLGTTDGRRSLQMVAVNKIKLPSNSFYFSRHLHDLQPYQGLLFAPHSLMSAGIIPDILDKIQNSGREDVRAVDGLLLLSKNNKRNLPYFESAGGGWWDYFGARQAYLELLQMAERRENDSASENQT